MINLNKNIYNARTRRDQRKLKAWRYAGLMLTYKCSAACQFCYYYCSPSAGGLMPVEMAIKAWQSLIELSGDSAKIHITGGEPFLYFDRLYEILVRADELGLTPLDSLETNGSWATDETDIADKLEKLHRHGLDKLKISYDPFHAEFIPAENIRKLIRVGRNILGPKRVLVRWEKYLQKDLNFVDIDTTNKYNIYRKAMIDDPCRFTGRAADLLADMAADTPADQFQGNNCRNCLLAAKGVHIDPFGHVFNGQCSGMVLGNVAHKSLRQIWQDFDPLTHEFWSVLYHHGPYGFLCQAAQHGYQIREKYASKCHLCSDIRRFFFDNGKYPMIIAPEECYSL